MSRDQQIVIERVTRTSDGQGGWEESWATAYTLFAEVRALGFGRELNVAERIDARQSYEMEFMAVDAPDVTEADRVTWNGVTLNIRSVPIVGRAVRRRMICEAGTPQ